MFFFWMIKSHPFHTGEEKNGYVEKFLWSDLPNSVLGKVTKFNTERIYRFF